MNNQLLESEFTPDWQSLNETRTELLSKHFQKAARLSQSIHLPQQRWEVYLCALGVLGFEQWLLERAPDLQFECVDASIWQPAYANLLVAACNIKVGNFKVCVLTNSSVPFAVLDIPDFTAHFYVLMQVEEEEQQVAVSGFMSYEQYLNYQQKAHLAVDSDWTYPIPSTWFYSNPNALLLNLRCLDADAIQLPTKIAQQNNTATALREKLTALTSQLQKQHFSQLLTVKEATTLLSNPDLIDWAYKIVNPSFAQPLINVGLWLRDRIDAVASELGWMLMPSLAVSELRSLEEEFEQIRSGLVKSGVQIPSTARGAYRDLESDRHLVRLYAIMWVLSETGDNKEWMLLIALGSQPQGQMPKMTLEVRDQTELLFTESLEDTNKGILYAQVIGNWEERFWVTVTVDDDTVFEIPPFGMELPTV
ncbi:DUF1822 family protein [Plectonema cf. radiosum LEGE 06105]|uniref:DUF1822 family protein n=1 Tax=Plectonema cf. radiosum LEGE 06105 TaxID=945769 RepID=A0A8J7K364_9CYAN|nr:DUF1822 family protein [Plectonema radiosum]MBE9215551.1 DUF1822 family protein [Plectonema cf. radiosum LEGE 06105]